MNYENITPADYPVIAEKLGARFDEANRALESSASPDLVEGVKKLGVAHALFLVDLSSQTTMSEYTIRLSIQSLVLHCELIESHFPVEHA